MAEQDQTVSLDPQGIENPGFSVDEVESSGVGSGCSDLTPENTLPKFRKVDMEDYEFSEQNYRRASMLQLPYRIAVTAECATKKFGQLKALDGVTFRVQEGTIYGLLGSSGCGKTTLLSCLVGLRKLDAGRILICGKAPGLPESGVPGRLIGYMPQEIALNGEFTIREVCHFFGRLYGMTPEKVEDRIEKLVNLLDMKKSKKAIKHMSGGQKRRASFLVALLHEPEILILDEPTVGVDPVLRSIIWTHLRELVDNCGTTVIITSHYIEEMRQADTVGIMRNGIVMTEGSPQELMDSHNATMLEDVVLHYCLKTEDIGRRPSVVRRRSSRIEEVDLGNTGFGQPRRVNDFRRNHAHDPSETPNGPNRPKRAIPYMITDSSVGIQTHSFNRIRALTLKNLIVMARSIGFLLFILICPASLVALTCYCMGSPPLELGLAVINDEGGDCTIGDGMRMTCEPKNLACAFANGLHATGEFTVSFYDTEASALKDVENSKLWGFVHFGSNFSQHIYDRTLRIRNTNETIEGAKISSRLDMSTVTTGQVIQRLIIETYKAFSKALLSSCTHDLTGLDLPIAIEPPIYGDPSNNKFRNYLAPGMTTGFICFMATLTCGLAYIVEKKDGMIHRTKVAGVTTIEIMISHFIPQFLIMIIQIICAFVIMFGIFDIPQLGSIFLGFFVTLWYGVSGTILGFMAAAAFDDEKTAMLCAVASMLPNFMLSGLVYPLETFPLFISRISVIVPGTQPEESLRSILLRGWGMSHYAVYMGFISPTIFMTIYVIITFAILKIRK